MGLVDLRSLRQSLVRPLDGDNLVAVVMSQPEQEQQMKEPKPIEMRKKLAKHPQAEVRSLDDYELLVDIATSLRTLVTLIGSDRSAGE